MPKLEQITTLLLAHLPFHGIDPFIFRIGDFGIRWYSVFYVAAGLMVYLMCRHLAKKGWLEVELDSLDDFALLFFALVIVGARVFYVVFYNPWFFLDHPLSVFKVWEGGLSFHGGLVGGSLAAWIYSRCQGVPLLRMLDAISLSVGFGLGLGRIGNFINGELYGRASDLPWAMIFPRTDGNGWTEPRHPSQLYESLIEGFLLAALLWWLKSKNPKNGVLTAAAITFYAAGRFLIEFTREPDPQLGFVLGPLTMGQLLSLAMLTSGFLMLWFFVRRKSGENKTYTA